jgi:hypothetical protein
VRSRSGLGSGHVQPRAPRRRAVPDPRRGATPAATFVRSMRLKRFSGGGPKLLYPMTWLAAGSSGFRLFRRDTRARSASIGPPGLESSPGREIFPGVQARGRDGLCRLSILDPDLTPGPQG